MAKSSESYFVVRFPLDTEPFQVDILNKRRNLADGYTILRLRL